MADENKEATPAEVAPATEETPAEATPAATEGGEAGEAVSPDELKEPQRISKPVRDRVLEAEAEIKKDIAVIDTKIAAITKKTKAESDARSGQNDGAGQARSEMKRLKQAKEVLLRERQEIYSSRESAKANLDAKMNERRDLKAQTKFKSVDEIDKRIAELDQLQHTTSMPLKEEKKILKEIDELKKSKKLVAQFSAVGNSIDDQRRSAEDYQAQIAAKNAQLESIKKEMDVHGEVLSKINDKKKDSAIPGLLKEKDALRAEKKIKQDEIQALWDEFKAANQKWKDNQNEWKAYKLARDKAFDAERQRRREEYKAARDAELAAKTPYEEEMALCDYLVNYLTTSFLGKEKEVVESKEVKTSYDGFEGAVLSKKKDDDNYLKLGAKSAAKRRAKKRRARLATRSSLPSTPLRPSVCSRCSRLPMWRQSQLLSNPLRPRRNIFRPSPEVRSNRSLRSTRSTRTKWTVVENGIAVTSQRAATRARAAARPIFPLLTNSRRCLVPRSQHRHQRPRSLLKREGNDRGARRGVRPAHAAVGWGLGGVGCGASRSQTEPVVGAAKH